MCSLKVEEYTRKFYIVSKQHKTIRTSRIIRNIEDTEKVISFVESFSSFNSENSSLHNVIASNIHAYDEVNILEYQSVGQKIIEYVKGKHCVKSVRIWNYSGP